MPIVGIRTFPLLENLVHGHVYQVPGTYYIVSAHGLSSVLFCRLIVHCVDMWFNRHTYLTCTCNSGGGVVPFYGQARRAVVYVASECPGDNFAVFPTVTHTRNTDPGRQARCIDTRCGKWFVSPMDYRW